MRDKVSIPSLNMGDLELKTIKTFGEHYVMTENSRVELHLIEVGQK